MKFVYVCMFPKILPYQALNPLYSALFFGELIPFEKAGVDKKDSTVYIIIPLTCEKESNFPVGSDVDEACWRTVMLE